MMSDRYMRFPNPAGPQALALRAKQLQCPSKIDHGELRRSIFQQLLTKPPARLGIVVPAEFLSNHIFIIAEDAAPVIATIARNFRSR